MNQSPNNTSFTHDQAMTLTLEVERLQLYRNWRAFEEEPEDIRAQIDRLIDQYRAVWHHLVEQPDRFAELEDQLRTLYYSVHELVTGPLMHYHLFYPAKVFADHAAAMAWDYREAVTQDYATSIVERYTQKVERASRTGYAVDSRGWRLDAYDETTRWVKFRTPDDRHFWRTRLPGLPNVAVEVHYFDEIEGEANDGFTTSIVNVSTRQRAFLPMDRFPDFPRRRSFETARSYADKPYLWRDLLPQIGIHNVPGAYQ